MLEEVGKKMAAGAGWTLLFTFVRRIQGLISIVILARLLVPEDFGLVAMATSIIAGIEVLTAFNFDIVLIQHRSPKRRHFDTAWTFNVLLGVFAALVTALLAPLTADFFNDERIIPLIYVLAFAFAINSLANIQIVWFRKDMQFQYDFLLRFAPRFLGFLLTIALAFYWRSYWALVIGTLVTNVVSVAFGYMMRPYLPRFTLSARKELFNFSKWLFLNSLVNYCRNRAKDLILGRVSGTAGLGLFSIAYDLSNMPTTQLTAPINRAVFPGYAKLSHDLDSLRQGYLMVTAVIALTNIPAALGIAAIAGALVPVLLGDKWLAAIPLIELLALYGGLNSLITNTGSVFNALARPSTITFIGLIQISILLPLLWFLTHEMGVVGAGWAYVIQICASLPLIIWLVCRATKLRVLDYAKIIWRPIVAGGVMWLAVTHALDAMPESSVFADQLLALFVGLFAGLVSYSSTIALLWLLSGRPEGAERTVWNLARGVLRKSVRSAGGR